jgi:hypothetical protein
MTERMIAGMTKRSHSREGGTQSFPAWSRWLPPPLVPENAESTNASFAEFCGHPPTIEIGSIYSGMARFFAPSYSDG